MRRKFKESKMEILKNTKKYALILFIEYILLFIYSFITLFKTSGKFKYEQLFFLPIFAACTIVSSRGYFIDLLLKNTSKIEGEIIEKENIYGIVNDKIIGNKITLRTSKGNMISISLYNNIEAECDKKQKIDLKESYKTIYHYLRMSKVVYFVEYAKECYPLSYMNSFEEKVLN